MITWIYEGILRLCKFADDHRTAFDVMAGGSLGFFPTIIKYWEHLTQEENLFHFYDGVLNTIVNTTVGALVLWIAHKFLKPKKKDDTTRETK
jgi:hypothetical protein